MAPGTRARCRDWDFPKDRSRNDRGKTRAGNFALSDKTRWIWKTYQNWDGALISPPPLGGATSAFKIIIPFNMPKRER
jgi:hypothetical protein